MGCRARPRVNTPANLVAVNTSGLTQPTTPPRPPNKPRRSSWVAEHAPASTPQQTLLPSTLRALPSRQHLQGRRTNPAVAHGLPSTPPRQHPSKPCCRQHFGPYPADNTSKAAEQTPP